MQSHTLVAHVKLKLGSTCWAVSVQIVRTVVSTVTQPLKEKNRLPAEDLTFLSLGGDVLSTSL
jgi:hypothetical protein